MTSILLLEKVHDYGLAYDLPDADINGRLFFASDTGQLWRDNGVTWDEIVLGSNIAAEILAALAAADAPADDNPFQTLSAVDALLDAAEAAWAADIATHAAVTTSVHGIANTANLVVTSDARLGDARTPVAHTHDLDDLLGSGGVAGQELAFNGTHWAERDSTSLLGASLDGQAATIVAGTWAITSPLPWAAYIDGADNLADQSGSISLNVWAAVQSDHFPPVIGDLISASAPMAISSAASSSDTTLTGWGRSHAKGTVFKFVVASCSGITFWAGSLRIRRTA